VTTELDAYLDRIHYIGPLAPTAEVLRAIHRAHLLSITYENLDIHLGRSLALDHARIFDKMVRRRRGGWCYEMNGLLGWALCAVGFRVTLLAGAVGRARSGDLAEGNHLVLLVQLDQPWLADAGFGNAFLEPTPLVEGEFEQAGFVFRLSRQGERWQFHNHPQGGGGFDFTLQPREMSDFVDRCHWLQTSPASGFTRVTTCHRWRDDGIYSLRGAVLQHVTPGGSEERVIEAEADYRCVLCDTFELDLGDDLPRLWPKVWQSHLAWVAAQQAKE
jgi:N-hydroxyarylamine O-acetyltransferase